MRILGYDIRWRQTAIVVGGVVALAYALSVLWYARSTPDIGLHCSFLPVLTGPADPGFVVSPDKKIQGGDRLVAVGHYRFRSEHEPYVWAQVALVRFLRDLQAETPRTVPSLDKADGADNVQIGADRFVRVRLVRPGDEAGEYSLWCRIGQESPEQLIPSIVWFFLKAGLFLIGALVYWKRPNDPYAGQFFLLCLVTLGAFMGGYHWSRIATQPVLLLVFMACAVLLPAVSLHFYMLFPRPKCFLERNPRRTLVALYTVPALFLTALVACYLHLRWLRQAGAQVEDTMHAWGLLRAVVLGDLATAALWYLLSVIALVHSFRSATNLTERNQVKWIVFGSVAALVPIGYTLYLIVCTPNDFAAGRGTWPMFAVSVFFTLAFAVSITRYRLMELEKLLSSGMVYFLISFAVGLLYYAVVFAGMLVSRAIFEPPSLSRALSVSTTVLVLLILLDLARNRFKRVLDRRFDRNKHQLDHTLRRMGEAIEQLVDPPTLARRLLQASAELLNVARGAVYVRADEPSLYRLAGELGEAPPLVELSPGCPLVEALQRRGTVSIRPGQRLPLDPAQRQLRLLGGEMAQALAHEGRLLALVVLGPKNFGIYTPYDSNLLSAFAQLTALALESAEGHRTIESLNHELQAKVEKISEQQRRILALQNQLTRQPSLVSTRAEAPTEPAMGESIGSRDSILGSSAAVGYLLELVRKVAATPSAVLIRGESGTGKGLLARALHQHSPRADKAFINVHCGALAPGLLESELFGHVKGAFTGAHRDKVGRFELADGGTLFLDEIGDISMEVQTKLLRVLEEKTFERVGSSEPVQVDVRIVAATHQDLEKLIHEGRFREDLYYRLKVIDIYVPPLRERREDIPELALHFLRLYAGSCGKAVCEMDDEVLAVLKANAWTGNVRELENVINRAVVVAEGTSVTVRDLPPELVKAAAAEERSADHSWESSVTTVGPAVFGLQAERAERDRRERGRLVRALAAAGGNKAEAARALGLKRSTLVSRLKKYGLS
ncbi:MAG TPA: sigma 54-interacting transcriptional regulator [Gemmataceae bacterium]|nr:sigma 54-interacting transcriptional regulator [Gemmataceae bacterium]